MTIKTGPVSDERAVQLTQAQNHIYELVLRAMEQRGIPAAYFPQMCANLAVNAVCNIQKSLGHDVANQFAVTTRDLLISGMMANGCKLDGVSDVKFTTVMSDQGETTIVRKN